MPEPPVISVPQLRRQERFGIWLLTMLLRTTALTSRVVVRNLAVAEQAREQYGAFLVSTWHQDIFFSIWMFRSLHLTALISASRDGEAIYQMMRRFNFKATRGSSNRGGAEGLLDTLQVLREGESIAIAPDGPMGPPLEVKPGIVLLAKQAQVPILPWGYACRREWRLGTWDRHRLPKPFNQIEGAFGEPLLVPPELPTDEISTYCRKLEDAMRRVSYQLRTKGAYRGSE